MRLGRPAVGKRVLHVTCHSLMNWLKIYICIFIRVFDVIFLGNDQLRNLQRYEIQRFRFISVEVPYLQISYLSFSLEH